MRWALTWLGIGFAIKWLKERGAVLFDVLLVLLSFALVCVVFVFWSFVVLMAKVE